jgi:transposase
VYDNEYKHKPKPKAPAVPVPSVEDKKLAVYLMRQSGADYAYIAESLKISVGNAYQMVSKYRKESGETENKVLSLKEQAYDLALEGYTEQEIGKMLDRDFIRIRQYVSRYSAERNVKNPFIRPKPKTKSQTAYELRCSGMSYKQVGAAMDGQSDQAARSLVIAYCRQHDLDIPRVVR